MKRTITVKRDYAVYNGREVGYIVTSIRDHFNLNRCDTYKITIKEGGNYSFRDDLPGYYDIYLKTEEVGHVCRGLFNKLFFVPDFLKTYSITVE